jgi:hydroxymethylpyrimidine/phosphomethylpyrimidine kinase
VLPPELVAEQIEAVLEDIPPAAAKTGALGSAPMVEMVAREAARWSFPLVVDPVMCSKHGAPLLGGEAAAAIRTALLPRATLVTPNIPEASALTGTSDMREAALRLSGMGARAVLIKGGHKEGPATDLLFDGSDFHEFPAVRIPTRHTHGTGCTYSAAITAGLARGVGLYDAIVRAKQFIGEAIRTNPGLGKGCGPVNHHAEVYEVR